MKPSCMVRDVAVSQNQSIVKMKRIVQGRAEQRKPSEKKDQTDFLRAIFRRHSGL